MRLSAATAPQLPAHIVRPAYDRDAQRCGIVHFGIGAFHRAHQAVYTDDAMSAGDRDWAITGISLRSPSVAAQMNPQDGLYTVTERSSAGHHMRLIGAVKQVIVARQASDAVVEALSSPATHIVSFTITEKGYCRRADGSLDTGLVAGSAYEYLARAMRERMTKGLPGLTLLCCDNLADNGAQLSRLMTEYLDRFAPEVRNWFESECRCPSTMVDRIVPATTDTDRRTIEAELGLRDDAAIVCEPFTQWVIEEAFAGPRPRWENVGAEFTIDVHAFETAKLRMLNGAHSALAYLGLAKGHEFVHQAVADPEIRALAEQLMRREAAPTIAAAQAQDLERYAGALLERFSNTAIDHRLAQIAMDGSQKIPQRWLETLAYHQRLGSRCPAILAALSAWINYVRGDRFAVSDPMAGELATLWLTQGREHIAEAIVGENGVFKQFWCASPGDLTTLQDSLTT